MKPQIDSLGKVAITVEQGYWDINKDYDKLTIVEVKDKYATYISRKPVLAGTPLTDRKYWIPFSSLKEEIVLNYNQYISKYAPTLENHEKAIMAIANQLASFYDPENKDNPYSFAFALTSFGEGNKYLNDKGEYKELNINTNNINDGSVTYNKLDTNVQQKINDATNKIKALTNNLLLLIDGDLNDDSSITNSIFNFVSLGAQYKSLYDTACTIKNFIENTYNEDKIKFNEKIADTNNNFNDLTRTLKIIANGTTNDTFEVINNKLKELGSNYESVYAIACTLKTFLESTDTVNATINTWREIEEFLSGISDDESLLELFKNINDKIETSNSRIDILEGKLLIIETGAKVNINISPGTIYKNIPTNVTISGSFSSSDTNLIPKFIRIKQGDTNLKMESNVRTSSYTQSLNLSTGNQVYTIEASVDPNNTNSATLLKINGSINARNPIYAGFGFSVEEVFIDENKLSPRTSINGTYTKTATEDGVNYFILCPSDISAPNNFTMGGAPYVMNKSTEVINDVTYTVCKSGGTYNSGASVNINVS